MRKIRALLFGGQEVATRCGGKMQRKVKNRMRMGSYEISFHRSFYTCDTCTHVICGCTSEDSLAICSKKIGTLFVSKIDKGDESNRRVQETGHGDASADYVDLALYRSEERPEDSSDSKRSR